jgi:hypothetical protein
VVELIVDLHREHDRLIAATIRFEFLPVLFVEFLQVLAIGVVDFQEDVALLNVAQFEE